MAAAITSEFFGSTKSGERVERWTLTNAAGMLVRILDYGCTVQSIFVPDAMGTKMDVVLGYDDLSAYEAGSCYFGAFIGRYANRIRGAELQLDGRRYSLEKNDGENHLHGVYSRRVFSASVEGETLVFRRASPDGEEGFPGTLETEVRYRLTQSSALEIEYRVRTDAETVLNLTNHSYFNLNGSGDILRHTLTLYADSFLECDEQTLPTGRIRKVAGTPMDFRSGRVIGAEIGGGDTQLQLCGGYDHNFIVNGEPGILRKMASARGDISGIRMEAYTTQPGVQLYTGNWIDRDTAPFGKGGVRYPRFAGFCLEAQHYPCSPSFPDFPPTLLRPGEEYRETTVYRFFSEETKNEIESTLRRLPDAGTADREKPPQNMS